MQNLISDIKLRQLSKLQGLKYTLQFSLADFDIDDANKHTRSFGKRGMKSA